MTTYAHVFYLGFEVSGSHSADSDDVSVTQIKRALCQRMATLGDNWGDWINALDCEDSREEEAGDAAQGDALSQLVAHLECLTDEIRSAVEQAMPSKGDREDDCQRLCLLNRLSELEYAVNGITADDMIEDDEQEGFDF